MEDLLKSLPAAWLLCRFTILLHRPIKNFCRRKELHNYLIAGGPVFFFSCLLKFTFHPFDIFIWCLFYVHLKNWNSKQWPECFNLWSMSWMLRHWFTLLWRKEMPLFSIFCAVANISFGCDCTHTCACKTMTGSLTSSLVAVFCDNTDLILGCDYLATN